MGKLLDKLFKKTKVYKDLNRRNRINWEWILWINKVCEVPKLKGIKPNQIAQFKGAASIKVALKYALQGKTVNEAFAEHQSKRTDMTETNNQLRRQHAITHSKETRTSNEREQQESEAATG